MKKAMMIRSLFPFLMVGVIGHAQTAPQNPNPGDPGEETPSTHRSIPLRLGSVDAVQGELTLRVPLGPKLPGRLTLGFTWSYDSQNPLQNSYDYGGGDFRPVVWPGSSTKRITYTVLVNGEAWSFPRVVTTATVNTAFYPPTIMGSRNIDDGKAQAVKDGSNYSIEPVGQMQWEAYVSPDGQRYFVRTWWQMARIDDPSHTPGTVVGGRRMFIVDKDNTIWTDLKGITHFTTVWGDHVSVTETGVTYASPWPDLLNGGSIVIRNENHTSQTLTLTAKGASLNVSNTLGLPTASLPGTWHYVQRTTREVLPQPETLFDVTFQPDTLNVTGDTTVSTTFGWTPALAIGGHPAPPLLSLTHPSGLKESFVYGASPFKKTADYAFSPDTGTWVGFKPSSNLVYNSLQYLPITKVTQDDHGSGSTVIITRVTPDWTENANPLGVIWNQTAHTTTVKTYPNTTGTGVGRTVRMTHPSYGGNGTSDGIWGNPTRATDSEMQAAYLFATGAVQKVELLDEAGSTYKTVSFGGWDTRTYANPSGAIAQNGVALALPIVASPTANTVDAPGLPQQVRIRQDWSTFAFQTAHTGAVEPGTTGSVLSSGSWGSTSISPATSIDTAAKTTWVQKANIAFVPSSVTRTLTGSKLASLRAGTGSTQALETTSYAYDSLNRVTTTTVQLGTGFTQETRVYSGTNPQPDSVTQWAGIGATLATAVPLNFAGKAGKTYTYWAAPDYFPKTETDALTGKTTSYVPDALGRVSSKTDPDGVTTTTTYDVWGRVNVVTRQAKGAVGALTKTTTYDPNGAWIKLVVTGAGKTLTSWTYYDGFGRVIKEVSADGGTRTTTYNGYGEKASQSPWLRPGQTPYGNYTFIYDGKGRLTETRDPKGHTLSKTPLDPAWNATSGGVVTTTSDDRGYARSTVVDLLNQQKSMTDPKGKVTSFTYDKYGRMSQMSLSGQVRSSVFDDLGHMTSRVEPEEGETQYSDFTVWGVPGKTIQKGISGTATNTIQTVFDPKGRATQVSDPAAGTFVRSIQYDPTYPDRISYVEESQADGVMRETYGYDDIGRMNSKVIKDDFGQSFMVSQTIDALGNVTALNYPSQVGFAGATYNYGFDTSARPSTVSKGSTNRATMTYDIVATTAATNRITFGSGAKTERKFDQGELTNITHTVGAEVQSNPMTWTAGGLLMSRGGDAFDYDELGRMKYAKSVGLSGEVHTQNFTYDDWGNRTQNAVSTVGTGVVPAESLSWTASYGANDQIPLNVFPPTGPALPTGASYDDFGHLNQVWAVPGQSSTVMSWIYDSSGRMTMENGTKFLLDAQGLRFRRTMPDNTVQYTVYGFNRDPLSTFETSLAAPPPAIAPSGVQPAAATTGMKGSATATKSKGQATQFLAGTYGKMKRPPTSVQAPMRYTAPPSPQE